MLRANNLLRIVIAAFAALWIAMPATAADLTIGLATDITSLDPHFHNVTPNNSLGFHIFGYLVERDEKSHLVPGLATEWKTIDPTTWEFKLRPSITFTNGEPFNADAVVASVTRIIDPTLKSEQISYFGTITGAKKVDDLTVDITTNGPDPILPARMYWMKMVPPKYASDPNFASHPIGTGP